MHTHTRVLACLYTYTYTHKYTYTNIYRVKFFIIHELSCSLANPLNETRYTRRKRIYDNERNCDYEKSIDSANSISLFTTVEPSVLVYPQSRFSFGHHFPPAISILHILSISPARSLLKYRSDCVTLTYDYY